MKIVHINTFDVGGAAKAALRLHEGLLQQNIESSFCVCKKPAKNRLIKSNISSRL